MVEGEMTKLYISASNKFASLFKMAKYLHFLWIILALVVENVKINPRRTRSFASIPDDDDVVRVFSSLFRLPSINYLPSRTRLVEEFSNFPRCAFSVGKRHRYLRYLRHLHRVYHARWCIPWKTPLKLGYFNGRKTNYSMRLFLFVHRCHIAELMPYALLFIIFLRLSGCGSFVLCFVKRCIRSWCRPC